MMQSTKALMEQVFSPMILVLDGQMVLSLIYSINMETLLSLMQTVHLTILQHVTGEMIILNNLKLKTKFSIHIFFHQPNLLLGTYFRHNSDG